MNTRVLNVELCDDMDYIHEEIKKTLYKYEDKNHIDVNLSHSFSGAELLDKDINYDILLLDIDLGDSDGIDIAGKLHERNADLKIIMLTSNENRYKDAFKIQAFRFVTKPVDYDEFESAVNDAAKYVFQNSKLDVMFDGIHCEVKQTNIVYMEVTNSFVNVFTKDGSHGTINSSMVILEEMLDNNLFVRINRNITVNLMYIKKLHAMEVVMEDGTVFPISVRKKLAVKKAFMEYDLKLD